MSKAFQGQEFNFGITVRELQQLLAKANPNAKISLEGCDCYGPLTGMRIVDEKHVELLREKEEIE